MDEEILRDILASNVIIIANQLKAEAYRSGQTGGNDYIYEAVNLVRQKKSRILQRLGGIYRPEVHQVSAMEAACGFLSDIDH
jgi:hypothetical protein